MEAEVFSQQETVSLLNQKYVPVKINADHFPATARQYGITALPTTVITTADGQLVDSIRGRLETAQFIDRIGRVAADMEKRMVAEAAIASRNNVSPRADAPTNLAPPAPAMTAAPPPPMHQPGIDGTAAAQPPQSGNPPPTYGQPPYQAPTAPSYGSLAPPPAMPGQPPYNPNPTVENAPAQPPYNPNPPAANIPVQPPYNPNPPVANAPAQPPYNPNPPVANAPAQPPYNPNPPVANAPVQPPYNTNPPVANAPAQPPVYGNQPPAPANQPAMGGNPPLCLDGFCPVTLSEKQAWVQGDVRWGAIHRGRTYLFIGPEEQRRFFADPDRYAPVGSGNDVVLAAEQGRAVPGMREHGVFFGNRIYLFASEESLTRFAEKPEVYANQVLNSARSDANGHHVQ